MHTIMMAHTQPVRFAGSQNDPQQAVIKPLKQALAKGLIRNVTVTVEKVGNRDTIILNVGNLKQGMDALNVLKPLLVEKPGPVVKMNGKDVSLMEPTYQDMPVTVRPKGKGPFNR